MCNFFSCNSDGSGKVEFFKAEDIAKLMAEGNKKNYDFNSHTSIAHFHGHSPQEEDKWNKWEYDTNNKELTVDTLRASDDRKQVKKKIEAYLKDKDIVYLRNLYNMNSGYRNSGDMNSGDMNSGYRNSGDRNSGDRNSGDRNSGDRNSGDRNSGDMNSGDRNSGDMNSGDRNSGDMNSGDMNSGYRNSGDMNSGDNNSGCIIGHFSSKKQYFLFNKPCTEVEAKEVYDLDLWQDFKLNEWVNESDMTKVEKDKNVKYKVLGGYLKTIGYKEAWQLVSKDKIEKIKKIKNFDKEVFFEITGIKV